MFKKSSESLQLDIFSSPTTLYTGKTLKMYEKKDAWHNLFREQVTMRVNEEIFSPLYSDSNGSPNVSIRVLVAMMALKEAWGISDEVLFENCRFNALYRSALGLMNKNSPLPTESTYYLFRRKIVEYAEAGNVNLLETVFAAITKAQCLDFNVSGKSVRMDSKLIGSNIASLSRYEIIHESFRLFHKQVNGFRQLDASVSARIDELLKLEGNKVVYTCPTEEVQSRLQELGVLIYKVLQAYANDNSSSFDTLQRVFNDQFNVTESKIVIARDKTEISAKSVQSPHDTDADYRNKDGNKKKGYSINVTESCDEENINLIGNVDVRTATTSDVEFLQDDIEKVQDVFTEKTEAIHADGAYHSPSNQEFCKDNNAALLLHAIQGAKGQYDLELKDDGILNVLDTETNQYIEATKVICKDGKNKWRIRGKKAYRYFTQKDIDTCLIRRQIEQTPIEILQKRNNVEATIFQLGYHYPHAKTRYRGLIKHQMWANMRCLWVNFVRIMNFTRKLHAGVPNLVKLFTVMYQNVLTYIKNIAVIAENAIFENYFKYFANTQLSERLKKI